MTTGQASNGRTYGLGWVRGPERPDKWRYRLVPATAPDITKPRSLAQYVNVLYDQGAEGSCTANAGCLAAMMVANISGTPVPQLSRSWKYYQERLEINTFPQDSGADVVDEYDTDKSPGEIADSVWPYDANPSEQPPAAANTAQKYHPLAGWQPIASSDFRDGILTALDNFQPVSIGLTVWNGWMNAWEQTGIWNSGGMTGGIAGGHAVVIIGWLPPTAQFPQGAYLAQNSWGATSPNNTRLHPDCTSGRFLLDASTFALAQVGGEADAAVGQSQPAILSLTITGPSTAYTGQPEAFSAMLTGAPIGSVVSYSWMFGDNSGQLGSNATAGHTYAVAGSYTVTCTASVATTGAKATATFTVNVTVAPIPSQPTATENEVDAAFATAEATLAAQEAADKRANTATISLAACYYYRTECSNYEVAVVNAGAFGDSIPMGSPKPPSLPPSAEVDG